jgi:hypothetical protein
VDPSLLANEKYGKLESNYRVPPLQHQKKFRLQGSDPNGPAFCRCFIERRVDLKLLDPFTYLAYKQTCFIATIKYRWSLKMPLNFLITDNLFCIKLKKKLPFIPKQIISDSILISKTNI